MERMSVPTFIKQIDIYNCPGDLQVHTSAQSLAHGKIHAQGYAIGTDGSLAMRLDRIKLTPLDATSETDPHAGALMTWDLEPSFTTMSALVEHNTEAAKKRIDYAGVRLPTHSESTKASSRHGACIRNDAQVCRLDGATIDSRYVAIA